MLLMTNFIASAADIVIYPQTIDVNCIGGDSFEVIISVNSTKNVPVECFLYSEIKPDDEGFKITYSKNNFTIKTGEHINVTMIVNTSMLLIPDVYTITTKLKFTETIIENEGENKNNQEQTTSSWEPEPPIIPENPGQVNHTKKTVNKINNPPPYRIVEEKVEQFPYLIFLGIAIIILMVLYVLYKKNKKP